MPEGGYDEEKISDEELERMHYEEQASEEERRWMQVTREIAIDAGDRRLEGEWIRW